LIDLLHPRRGHAIAGVGLSVCLSVC